MKTHESIPLAGLKAALAVLLLAPPGGYAQDDKARVRKDLQTVIALQGKPCGSVTGVERKAENDYVVKCSDGNRYRVRVDDNDRVVITKQN